MAKVLEHFRFGDDVWDASNRYETSWILKPWILFGIRASISLYAFTVLIFSIAWEISKYSNGVYLARFQFSFFTILCYWGLAFYFLVASIHTFSYALHGGTPLLNRFPRPLQALHALFHTTITTYPFLVTVIYWGVIFRTSVPVGWFPDRFSAWLNVSEHGLNSAFALFEILFTRSNPAPWIHLLWLLLILSCYLGLAYVTVATKKEYVYEFLDPAKTSNGLIAGYVFGIAIIIVIVFCAVKGLVKGRKWVTEKKLGRRGVFFAGRSFGNGEVELEEMPTWAK